MNVMQVEFFVDEKGKSPFLVWLKHLKNPTAQALISKKLNRLSQGNFGDAQSIGGGLQEFRVHHGPGYRGYFGVLHNKVVLILCGGDKSTQSTDIKKAKAYWRQYLEDHPHDT